VSAASAYAAGRAMGARQERERTLAILDAADRAVRKTQATPGQHAAALGTIAGIRKTITEETE
jgi:hypothetical protein